MNYKCPCCAFPRLGPGRYVKETWFGEKLIELVRNEKCKVCGSTYTAIFKVGESNYDYNDVVFKDIQVPEKIVKKIYEKDIETEFDYRDYLPRKSNKPDSDDNWHIDNETSFVKDGIEYFVVDLINKVGLVLLMGVVNGNVCVMGEKKYIYNYKPNFIIPRPKLCGYNKNNNENEHKVFTIPCIGIDGLIHECEPQSDTAICGCIVVKKKVGKYDYKTRFSCYPCIY